MRLPGFIPACAGAGCCPPPAGCPGRVHPGVRRSGSYWPGDGKATSGSSRRAPERARRASRSPCDVGFIPACAGAGWCSRPAGRTWRVHPGVRRSGSAGSRRRASSGGSSRRAPERASDTWIEPIIGRFIPACAGAGPGRRGACPIGWVHPGVRRSGAILVGFHERLEGSSRRAPERGKKLLSMPPTEGFIPACAGAGSSPSSSVSPVRVHPGVRRSGAISSRVRGSGGGSSRRAPERDR